MKYVKKKMGVTETSPRVVEQQPNELRKSNRLGKQKLLGHDDVDSQLISFFFV